MAYKPPKQTIVDNDLNYVPSNEAVFEALKLKLDEPTVSGTNGQLLQLTGYVGGEATTSWVNPPSPLPSQTGNLDKVLVTDGTNASWQFAGLGAGSLGTNNIILGRSKPTSFVDANDNIIVGVSAGNSITTARFNVLIGTSAGQSLTTGGINRGMSVAVGNQALDSTAGGSYGQFTAIGYQALRQPTGHSSTAVGFQAGRLAQGERNTFVGALAGSNGAGGQYITAIGADSLKSNTASNNTALGAFSGQSVTTGADNVFIGYAAGAAVTTSSQSTAVGTSALSNLVAGGGGLGRGVAIGHEAAFSVTNAYITAVGYQAARNGGGETAVAIGTWAGRGGLGFRSIGIGYRASDNNTGSSNIAIGGDALLGTASVSNGGNNIAIGPSAGLAVTTGTGNVFLGNTAGDAVTTGSNNVIIGDIAGSTVLTDTIVLAAGTAERVRVNSVGSVGINTTNPSAQLDVTGSVEVSSGDISLLTVGEGIRLNTDTNSKLGTTAAFPATSPNTVTVSTTAVRSNSKIFVTTASNPGGHQPDVWVDSITDSTNFVLKAHDNNFNGTVNWFIVDPLYEPDSEAFFTAASITDATQKLAVDTLVRDLKRYGLWSKMTAIYPFVGGTASAHSYNLKDTTQYQITWNGTVTHNSNGIAGNGTTGYGNLNIAPNAIGTQNDQHISIYSRTDINQSSYDIYSVGASSDSGITARFLGSFNPKINMTGWPNAAVSSSLGLFTASRTSSTLIRGYQNNITRYSPASYSSAAPSANNLFICAGNNGAGVANNFSTRNYAFASVGTGLSDSDVGNLYKAVQQFQFTLNRAVY